LLHHQLGRKTQRSRLGLVGLEHQHHMARHVDSTAQAVEAIMFPGNA